MPLFMPTPYPDELLYSLLARYHVRSGNQAYKSTIEDIFGNKITCAIVDLQSNLNALVDRLPVGCNLKSEDLIRNYTLFPVYQPFLTPERAEIVRNTMKGNKGWTIHTRVGIAASTISAKLYLYYCPVCFEAERNKYGEAYWHRIHQVPGVLVCPHHGTFLKKSSQSLSVRNQHAFIQANNENNNLTDSEFEICNEEIRNELLSIAKDIEWILENNLQPQSFGYYRDKYISKLKERGLATVSGRVYQENLENQFLRHFNRDLLHILQSDIVSNVEQSWLEMIVRKHRKGFHPIRHILMMRFLSGSVRNFFQENVVDKPFGDGPWVCLNPAAKHYQKECVKKFQLNYCYDTKKPVGIFTCNCGFIYSRRGPDLKEDDRFRYSKVHQYGPVWEEFLKNLIEHDVKLADISRCLCIDRQTVKTHAARLNVTTKWSEPRKRNFKKSSTGDEIKINKRNFYRDEWLYLQKINPNLTRQQLRKKASKIYCWLYRNDKDWLIKASPKRKKPKSRSKRIDWEQRDKEILLELQNVLNNWKDDEKPIRKTMTSVAKKAQRFALINNKDSKLPLSMSFLNSVCESVEEFQIRRIKWAIAKLSSETMIIKEWEVFKKAGLRPNVSDKVKTAIQQEISSLN